MATFDHNVLCASPTNRLPDQLELFALISKLCVHRRKLSDSNKFRVIVEGPLTWSVAPIDGKRSWLYLDQRARIRFVADCLVITTD